MARNRDTSEGMGAIVAVVAIAALIIMGLVYLMQPSAERTNLTSEAPPATTATGSAQK